ncbi:MAG: hypothetical protein HKN43_01765 [Rhodothermales bacterium]|nr:hypothetical protein [Rhodothermales bacterium]
MPQEMIFVLSIIGMTAGTGLLFYLVWNISEHLKAQRESGSSKSSMTTSELEKMMLSAAKQAVEPLTRRIENLESIAVEESDMNLLNEADSYYPEDTTVDSKIKVTREGRDTQ